MITVELSLEEWNTVLNVLGQGPWVTVNPIIGKIQHQAQAQLPPTAAPQPDLRQVFDTNPPGYGTEST
jgi:hypothetical protein